MSVMGKPVLYSYWRSSCSWRVRIALNLKEIPYEIKPISLIKAGGEQHCNEYREINPMEQVPALQIDGHTFVESKLNDLVLRSEISFMNSATKYCHEKLLSSGIKLENLKIKVDNFKMVQRHFFSQQECSNKYQLSIMHYLEETRPGRPLMPADVTKRAKVREICEVISSGIQPLQNLIVLIYVGEEKKKEWAQHWINRGFRAVEKLLSSSAGKYCVGDEVTLADCCLIPQVFNARRFHVDLRPFPIILRIDRELENHPAFRAAHPSNQPDCPPEATK